MVLFNQSDHTQNSWKLLNVSAEIDSNMTEDKIKYSHEVLSLFHSMYVLVMCLGILGNLLTCTVILLKKSMRRSIHFYAFNLAVCDLMILFVYVPTQMVYIQNQLNWTMGFVMCKIAYLVLPVSLFSTIGTLLAITIDRTRGLVQPFKWHADSTRYSKFTILGVWIISLIVNIPLFIISETKSYDGNVVCVETWPNVLSGLIYWNFMFVLSFAIPLLIIIVAHIVMIYIVVKETDTKHRKQNQRMISMLVALVLVFSICTGFQHVYFYMIEYFKDKIQLTPKAWALLFGSSNFVVSLQAALNPVIYGTLRHDFNKAFHYLFLKLLVFLKLQKELPRDFLSTNSTISRKSLRDTFRRTTFRRLAKREIQFEDSPLAPRVIEKSFENSTMQKRYYGRCLINNSTTKYIPVARKMEAVDLQNRKKKISKTLKNNVSTSYFDEKSNLTTISIIDVEQLNWNRNNDQLQCSTSSSILSSTSEGSLNGLNYDLFDPSNKGFSKIIRNYLDNSEETKV
ncbi:neuropeptide Y receptor type 6 [Hydra vulgaris]|uniref:Pyroglutamylated RFamide peptide receptor n=1 Tax=Hydra vulgaris TaxID=6087 RepID=T2M7M2_HYDVU|nr:neuropeptide Y receptor type 6-like [Hydra vulgaris]